MLDLSVPVESAPIVFAALVGVGELPDDARVRRLVEFVASELGVELPAELDEAPTPEQLATAIATDDPNPDARAAVVQRLAIAAMLVPPLTAARLERLTGYAEALGHGDMPVLEDLRRTLAGSYRRLTASLMRRFPPSDRLRSAWRTGGLGDRFRFVKAMLRLPDAGTAERYAKLAELPEGTLGRAFFEHCRANEFPLPGERGAMPEAIVFHDMVHALVGVPTDIDSEVLLGGFEAGCMGERGFTMIEFALLLFNLGAQLPTDAAPAVGKVDLDVLLRGYAIGRGSEFRVLTWDPWADVEQPVVELRERYGIAAPA